MTNYTIDFDDISVPDDSSYIDVAIVEPVQCNEAHGDQIGIYTDGNILQFSDMIDIDDRDVRDFIKTHFKDYRAVQGLIRKLTE